MRKMIDYVLGTKESRDKELKGLVLSGAILGLLYYAVSSYPAGWLTYWLMVPSCLVILLTALARVNDMSLEHKSWRWQIRKLGFILAGTASVAVLCIPFTDYPLWPRWSGVMLAAGVALSWITTPNMIPWHRYISGEFRKRDLALMADGEKLAIKEEKRNNVSTK